jgi:hypothetical protein
MLPFSGRWASREEDLEHCGRKHCGDDRRRKQDEWLWWQTRLTRADLPGEDSTRDQTKQSGHRASLEALTHTDQ